jgi:O-antigen ligase
MMLVADSLAVAVVASLPISTSLTAILTVAWLIALIPVLDLALLRQQLTLPAAALPAALVLFGAIGMAWADVSAAERWDGFESFLKLAAIPLLFVQFRGSPRAIWALYAYLGACIAVLLLSILFSQVPSLYWRDMGTFPTPFKNQATQSGEFVACIFIVLYLIIDSWRAGAKVRSAGLALLVLALLNDIAFSATGRTALAVAVILVVVLGFKCFRPRGMVALLIAAGILGAVLWNASPYLQQRTTAIWTEIDTYRSERALTSSGERLEFWRKAVSSIARAPLLGHGTGSIPDEMWQETAGQTGEYATVTPNPHQQTLTVAMQLGIAGAIVLWAMWVAHLLLFRGTGLVAWVGLVVVVQNIVGSLFNTHLFDFTQGWTYVFGIGIAGGAMLRQFDERRLAPSEAPPR